ncbi:MAG: hypothetical protein ACE5MI_11020 [Acidimicrobiia bacterium]
MASPDEIGLPWILPTIVVTNRHLRDLSYEALRALVQANDPPEVFVHAGGLARLRRDDGGCRAERMSTAMFRGRLDRVADFVRITDTGNSVAARPPSDVVSDLLAAGGWPEMPPLDRIVTAPVFASDGSLMTDPGYHRRARVYYHAAGATKKIDMSSEPTEAELRRSVDLIVGDLLVEFPFVESADRANTVAMLPLPFARSLFDGPTPLHVVEAPTPGSGKTLLVQAALLPFLGRIVEGMAEGRDEDEWRKRLTSKLAMAPEAFFIDNIQSELRSSSLASAITASFWEDRRLGKSEIVRYPVRCLWVVTGNNPQLSIELARRAIPIRLDANEQRPWQRTSFKHPLPEWAIDHRTELVEAALTIIHYWLTEERPPAQHAVPMGMFDGWSRTMAGILETAGIDGFMANADRFYEAADVETAELGEFIESWWAQYGDRHVGVADLFAIADDCGFFDLGEGTPKSQRTKLGQQLRGLRDKVVGGHKIIAGGKVQNALKWRLERFKP